MSQPIKALQFRTKKYAWSLATVSWLLAIGNSSQAIIYRKSLHYIHNSTFIGTFENFMSKSYFITSEFIMFRHCLVFCKGSCRQKIANEFIVKNNFVEKRMVLKNSKKSLKKVVI